MTIRELSTSTEKLLAHPRIIHENPFSEAIGGICAEWLQLLLVVEKIKQDKGWLANLRSIESLVQAAFTDPEVDSQTKAIHRGVRNDFHYSPDINQNEANKWGYLAPFFETLDEGQKYENFLSRAVQTIQIQERAISSRRAVKHSHQRNILLEVFPELCSNKAFDWPNLNEVRLHYPHHLILRAYLYGDKLLDAIEALTGFDDNAFSELCAQSIETVQRRISNGQAPFPKTINVLDAIDYRHDLVNAFNDAILHKTITRINLLIWSIPASIHFRDYNNNGTEYGSIPYNYVQSIEVEKSKEGLLLAKLPITGLTEALDNNNERPLLELLIKKIYQAVEKDLKQTTRERLFPSVQAPQHEHFTLPEPVINALWEYQHWCRSLNYVLFRKETGFKLAQKAAIRGIRFSVWFDKIARNKKSNIGEGVKKFSESCNKYGTALTVKQSYEAIKRFSLQHLSEWIFNQVKERAYHGSSQPPELLTPLNIMLDKDIQSFKEQVTAQLPWVIEQEAELKEFIELHRKLQALYEQYKGKSIIEAADAYLQLKGEILHRSDKPIASFHPNRIEPIKLVTLQRLLRYRIDVFSVKA